MANSGMMISMVNVRSLRRVLRGRLLPGSMLLTAMLAMCAVPAWTQQFPLRADKHARLDVAEWGHVLVKVRPDLMRRGLDPASFGEASRRYGIYQVRPWLPPGLLRNGAPVMKSSAMKTSPAQSSISSLERIMVVSYSALDRPERVADELALLGDVEYAEPIYPRRLLSSPNDPDLYKQWYLDSARIKAAWDVQKGDSSIIVAITDTGVERLHPELKDAIWYNPLETGDGPDGDRSIDGIDNDSDGVVDDWWGYDFSGPAGDAPDNDPSATGDPHGVEVAGVVGAHGNNALGIAGVAYGVKLMAVKVTDDRHGQDARVHGGAQGVLYAAVKGARIINCSWGGTIPSRAEREVFEHVINDRGALVVAAAGNDGVNEDYYPASYPGVLSIASITQGDTRSTFSNYNYRVDLSAPGNDVYTTNSNSGYRYDDGTSFSAPIVSGIAALVALRYPAMRGDQIAELLRATTDDISTSLGEVAPRMGSGRVNARRALDAATTITSARMVDYRIIESIEDGGIDPGEPVEVAPTIRNLLADASDVSITMSCVSDPSITISGGLVDLGAMTAGQAKAPPPGTFRFTAPVALAPDMPIVLKVTISTQGRIANQYITLAGLPTFLTTDYNDVVCTFNSTGNIGHDGVEQGRGEGFVYRLSEDYMYHGGVMIGFDATHVSNTLRVGDSFNGVADGFRYTQPYRLSITSDSTQQIGHARFNDSHLLVDERVGVDVAMTTHEYRDAASRNIVIVSYEIHNTTAATLDGLRCGLYLDWDVSSSGFGDRVAYDPDHHLGYQRQASPTSPFVGALVLTGASTNFYGVNNDADGVSSAFTPQRKWGMMTAGIHENSTIDDMAMVVSGEPFTLAPGAAHEVAFALVAAPTFDSLRMAADRARALFIPSGVTGPRLRPASLAARVVPNPVSGDAWLAIDVPGRSEVSITLTDARGGTVRTIAAGVLDAGTHELPLPVRGLPSGLYLYQVRSSGGVLRGTFVKNN